MPALAELLCPTVAPLRLGVVNRFGPGPYALGEALAQAGITTVPINLATATLSPAGAFIPSEPQAPLDGVLWRLSENVWGQCAPLAGALAAAYTLINPFPVLATCADKWATYIALLKRGIPQVPTEWVAPGALIPDLGPLTVVKPAKGAGGRGVRLRTAGERLNEAVTESWVAQPWAGSAGTHIRVLVVAGTVVDMYRRIPPPGSLVNSIDAGGSREPLHIGAAAKVGLAAAAALGAVIAGVDLVEDGLRVLEVNGAPGIPPSAVVSAASALSEHLRRGI